MDDIIKIIAALWFFGWLFGGDDDVSSKVQVAMGTTAQCETQACVEKLVHGKVLQRTPAPAPVAEASIDSEVEEDWLNEDEEVVEQEPVVVLEPGMNVRCYSSGQLILNAHRVKSIETEANHHYIRFVTDVPDIEVDGQCLTIHSRKM